MKRIPVGKPYRVRLGKRARKALATYRLHRRMGQSPSLARAHAHFAIMCLPGGRKNLFAENLLRRYRKESK